MKKSALCAILAVLILFQGCCSILTSDQETISIDSKPQGAKVQVGPFKGVTPYQASLPRGKDYFIVASYGNETQTMTLNKTVQSCFWVNLLFGLVFIIDWATGKMFKYEPTEYEFNFEE
jgi:hypothetical protein